MDASALVIAAPMEHNAPSLNVADVTVPDIASDALAEQSDSEQNSVQVRDFFPSRRVPIRVITFVQLSSDESVVGVSKFSNINFSEVRHALCSC